MPIIFTAPETSNAWDISAFSYDSITYSTPVGGSASYGMHGSAQGHRFYVTDDNTNVIRQINLGTDWDLSTAIDGGFANISGGTTVPSAVVMKPDGTKMYVGSNSAGKIIQYSLTTPWELPGGISIQTTSFNTASEVTGHRCLRFSDDGTKMYAVGSAGTIYQYTMPTPWDLNGIVYSGKSWVTGDARSFDFKTDGTKVYRVGETGDTVFQYSLLTAWDISTASDDGKSTLVNPPDPSPTGIFFKPDGTRFMLYGAFSYDLYQYSTP